MKCSQVAESFSLKADGFLEAKKYTEALENYNQCLRFAEDKSQVLSDAYAGRAKVYCEAQQLEKCIDNIQCAIDTCVRDEKREEFQKLREHCENLRNVASAGGDNDPWSFFKLTRPAHQKIPFIADCLEVRENDLYGRYIMTTSDLKTGDIVVVEEPFYKVLDLNQRHTRCAVCLRQNMLNLSPCLKCPNGESVNDFQWSYQKCFLLSLFRLV